MKQSMNDTWHLQELASGKRVLFQNQTIGGSIPPNFIPACEKGFIEAAEEGPLIGHPIQVCFAFPFPLFALAHV